MTRSDPAPCGFASLVMASLRQMALYDKPHGGNEGKMASTHASAAIEGRTTYQAERTDPVAVKAVSRVFKAWRVSAPDAARLAGVSERTWSRMKGEAWSGSLSDDQRTRAGAIVRLYKGLHLYFGEDLADKWVRMPNKGPLFEGATPVAYMTQGGLPAILAACEYVDAIRGGV